MATGRVPTTANSPLTAKGDLFTYSTAPARLAVGNNGEQIVADSSTSTGLRYQVPVNVNPVINSAFQIWQRGTTFASIGTTQYSADRWYYGNGGTSNYTISRQATGDTTNLPFIQYCARLARASGNTNTAIQYFANVFETINSIPYAGKTITFSYYARVGANWSGTGFSAVTSTGTTTDASFFSGPGSNAVATSSPTLTTTWQRFTATGTVAASATQMAVYFNWSPSGTAGANDWIEITGVQVECGSVATPFKTNGATIQGELAAAQRYYYRFVPFAGSGGNYYGPYAVGGATSTTNAYVTGHIPVAMRSAPTFNRSGSQIYNSASNIAVTALGNAWATGTSFSINVTVASGLTAGQVCHFAANNNSADYFDLSAEL